MIRKVGETLLIIGLIALMVGIGLPLIYGPQSMLYRYVFSVGALLTLVARLMTPYKGPYLRVKRLHRILVWAALFFCAAGFFMFYAQNARDWLAFALAGALIQIYVSIVLPRAERRAREEARKKN